MVVNSENVWMNKEHHVGCCFAWKLENSRGNACFDDNRNLQANVCEKYGFVIILHLWSEVFSQVKMNTQKINTPLFIREKKIGRKKGKKERAHKLEIVFYQRSKHP